MTQETLLIGSAVLAVLVAFVFRDWLAEMAFRLLAPEPVKEWVRTMAMTARTVKDLKANIITTITKEAEKERENFLPKLRSQVATLRKERDQLEEGWFDIPVCVWGVRAYEGDKFSYRALVQYSPKYQLQRAHPDPRMRKLTKIGDGMGFPLDRVSNHFPFGAPHYHKVEGEPKKVVMLGETYSL